MSDIRAYGRSALLGCGGCPGLAFGSMTRPIRSFIIGAYGNGVGTRYQVTCRAVKIVVSSTYVLVRDDGSLATRDCTANRDAFGTIVVQPSEDIVSRVHLKCKKKTSFQVRFNGGKELEGTYQGLHWVGGTPAHLSGHLDIH